MAILTDIPGPPIQRFFDETERAAYYNKRTAEATEKWIATYCQAHEEFLADRSGYYRRQRWGGRGPFDIADLNQKIKDKLEEVFKKGAPSGGTCPNCTAELKRFTFSDGSDIEQCVEKEKCGYRKGHSILAKDNQLIFRTHHEIARVTRAAQDGTDFPRPPAPSWRLKAYCDTEVSPRPERVPRWKVERPTEEFGPKTEKCWAPEVEPEDMGGYAFKPGGTAMRMPTQCYEDDAGDFISCNPDAPCPPPDPAKVLAKAATLTAYVELGERWPDLRSLIVTRYIEKPVGYGLPVN